MTTETQDVGLLRNTKDKFYTNINISKLCLEDYKKTINILEDDLCIEPSAGDGSFLEYIKECFINYKFYDIEPNNSEINTQDYFNLDIDQFKNYNSKIHVIGNPPFGRQSSLAIKFIKKSCIFGDYFGFILPKSFKKDSMKNKIPLNFHNIFEKDLPINSFLVDNKIHDVPCIFQIWEKRDYKRLKSEKIKPKNYKFVKKDENPDIAFRRVGGNAGNIFKIIENKSIQSHYFIKFTDFTNELYKKIEKINYKSKEYTAGPMSISKQELISEFNKITQ
jgi:hypothetical protein